MPGPTIYTKPAPMFFLSAFRAVKALGSAACAEVGYDSEGFVNHPKCVNYQGYHPAYSQSCPKWTTEKEVQVVKMQYKFSYPESRKIVDTCVPRPGLSYSSVLKQLKNSSIQTETYPNTVNSPNKQRKAVSSNSTSLPLCQPPLSVQNAIMHH